MSSCFPTLFGAPSGYSCSLTDCAVTLDLIFSYIFSQISIHIENYTSSEEKPLNTFSDVYKQSSLMQ